MDSQASQLTLGLLPEPAHPLGKVRSQLWHAVAGDGVLRDYGRRVPGSSGDAGARLPLCQPGQHSAPGSAGSSTGQAFPCSCSKDHRTGNAAARSSARSRRMVAEKVSSSRGAGAQGHAGCQERNSAGREAADSPAAGQNECVLHRKLGYANHGGRAAESTNRRLRRSQRRARIG